MDCNLPGFSVHGIFQARVLEWVAISFSRGSSRPRDRTWLSRIVGRHFTLWATREALEDDNSEWQFFLFLVSSWGNYLLSFFTFPICFRCQMTIEWSMLGSSATSPIAVRGSPLMMVLSWLLSTSTGWPLHSSSSRLSSPFQNILNHHCTVIGSSSGPNALLMLWVVSAALWPILNSNKNRSNLLLV